MNWCDLCLPANEQAFAEAHRIKIQQFQARDDTLPPSSAALNYRIIYPRRAGGLCS